MPSLRNIQPRGYHRPQVGRMQARLELHILDITSQVAQKVKEHAANLPICLSLKSREGELRSKCVRLEKNRSRKVLNHSAALIVHRPFSRDQFLERIYIE